MTTVASYLASLIRHFVEGGDAPTGPPEPFAWDALLHLMAHRGVTGTLAPLLRHVDLPPRVREEIERQERLLGRQSALLGFELERVLRALDRQGLEVVVLKGAALGRTVYPGPERRLMSDLDLLMRRDALQPAHEILGSLGYSEAIGRRHSEFYERHHFHRVLSGPSGVEVELHWDLSRPSDYFRFDLDAFFRRCRTIEHDGLRLTVPSTGDQLLHAACQALRDGFTDLRRPIDAALLLGAEAPDTSGLARRAHRQGMASALWMLLRVTRAVAGRAAPAELEQAVRPKPIPRRCLESLESPGTAALTAAEGKAGPRRLGIWLCAPSARAAAGEIRRFMVPGRSEHLDAGHGPERMPGVAARLRISAHNAWWLAKIAAYLGWRLVRRPFTRDSARASPAGPCA